MSLTTILFDFDNTLIFGDKDELAARLKALSERMQLALSENDIIQVSKLSDYTEIRRAVVQMHNETGHGFPITERDYTSVMNGLQGRFDDRFYLADGVPELPECLTAENYGLGIVTTRSRIATDRLLTRFNIGSHFDVVVTRDDCDERKPSPKPLLLAAFKLGVEPQECMYVGDKQNEDVAAANAAGMISVLIGEHRADSSIPQPIHIITSLKDIYNLLDIYRN